MLIYSSLNSLAIHYSYSTKIYQLMSPQVFCHNFYIIFADQRLIFFLSSLSVRKALAYVRLAISFYGSLIVYFFHFMFVFVWELISIFINFTIFSLTFLNFLLLAPFFFSKIYFGFLLIFIELIMFFY